MSTTAIERNHSKLTSLRNCFQATLATDDEVPGAIAAVVAQMRQANFTDKDIFAVRLALEEGLVNALKHGNGGDPSKIVQLRYAVCGEMLLVEIEDEGDGFDPQQVPDPLAWENMEKASGRGLLLMRSYTTWLRHNARGNCIRFARRRGERLRK